MEPDEAITTNNVSTLNLDEEFEIGISKTRYPDKLPSYFVAFSLKDTFDDLVTAQQMICNKRSPQERSPQDSMNSITPTDSLKTLDNEQAEKSNQNIDVSKLEAEFTDKKGPLDGADSFGSMKSINSLKYLNNGEASDASLVTVENIVIDLSSTDDIDIIEEPIKEESYTHYKDKELSKLEATENKDNELRLNEELTAKIIEIRNEYPINDKLISKTNNYLEPEKVIIVTQDEPYAIFKSTKTVRKEKKRKLSKRKLTKVVNAKHKKFKYKNPRKAIDGRLEKYYQKRTSVDADRIQRDLYSEEVSIFVSRTRILQKIIARENLLSEIELSTFNNDVSLNGNDDESIKSSLSTAEKSMVSNNSSNTLTQKNSNTSYENEDESNVEAKESIINTSTENMPYKSDVINVAVAVAYDRTKVKTRNKAAHVPSKNEVVILESLTSLEIKAPNNTPLDIEEFEAVTIEASENTLVNKHSSFGMSSDDFFIARTSSEFASNDSTFTLKNETYTMIEKDNANTEKQKDQTLLETVINLGIYPEMTPSTSSNTPYEYDYNDVLVTGTHNNNKCSINSNGDNENTILSKSILQKTVNQQNSKPIRTINLPNQDEIKALLNKTDQPQIKCTEEARHPSHMPEMWEKLVMTLDLAVRRLEDTLADKIIKELKAFVQLIPYEIKEEKDKVTAKDSLKRDAEQGEQCDLVKNKIIDQIMDKLSMEGPKIIEPIAKSLLDKTKVFEEFEVLKPPNTEVAEKDTVTVSTATYSNEVCTCGRLELLVSGPVKFIRENMFVITSVPTFFIVLLCVYGVILFLMKPW